MEQKILAFLLHLGWAHTQWLERIVLRVIRYTWREKPWLSDDEPNERHSLPTGPFIRNRICQMGDLLIWTPRRTNSFLIDMLTGSYGYSSLTVDTGEVDLPTGKAVMIEPTIGGRVLRKFQDESPGRPYVRIPISKTGGDALDFVACIEARLSETCDSFDALTLGEIDDPVRQMCPTLASNSLPVELLQKISKARRKGLLNQAAVSLYSTSGLEDTRPFISPNGFAQYFGAPRGQKLLGSDIWIDPHPVDVSTKNIIRHRVWKAVTSLPVAGALAASTTCIMGYTATRLFGKKN